MMVPMREARDTGLGRRGWARVALLWLLAAAAWTPAALLTGPEPSWTPAALAAAFLQMLVHFAPWAASVPLFLALSRRYPIGVGRSWSATLVFAALAAVTVPLFTAAGVAAARLLLALAGAVPAAQAFAGFWQATLLTGLFALPTYVALVAIGQTIAWFERFRERERLLGEARSQALRAQVTPHFLFNALNAISALGYSDPARADRAMVQLAGLLRATLDRPDFTTLRDEIALLVDLVELHRLLLGDRLSFDLDVAPEAWGARLPTLLLQPLVENALQHGIARLPGGGTLRLAAARGGNRLEVEVRNDAPPAGGEADRSGIGLANVRGRLASAFGTGGTLDFTRSETEAVATVRLPWLAEREE